MATIFHSDNSGVLALLIGMIALVMFGVGISLVMDGSIGIATSSSAQEELIATQEADIIRLETELKILKAERTARAAIKPAVDALQAAKAKIEANRKAIAELRSGVQGIEREVEVARDKFATFRDRYRRKVWLEATGTDLGTITTRAGKTYHGVVIKKITPVEMLIMHSGGGRRIPIEDLQADLQERYQLDPQEADRLVREEKEREERRLRELREKKEIARRKAEEKARREAEDLMRRTGMTKEELARQQKIDAEIAELRVEVDELYDGLGELQREVDDARSRLGGREQSPRGSLETWAERYQRLAAKERRALGILREKEARLKELDPRYVSRPSSRPR